MILAGFGLGIPTALSSILLDGDSGGRDEAVLDAGASSLVFDDALVKDSGGSDVVGRVVVRCNERCRVALGFVSEADATPMVLAGKRQFCLTNTTGGGGVGMITTRICAGGHGDLFGIAMGTSPTTHLGWHVACMTSVWLDWRFSILAGVYFRAQCLTSALYKNLNK